MSYFEAKTRVLDAAGQLYKLVGDAITERGGRYNRATFYADAAAVIRALLEMQASPFIESEENWAWWADQCEQRAAALGDDTQFTMQLPDPMLVGDYKTYERTTNALDKMVSLMLSVTKTEEEDADINDFGNLTPGECAKLTHRFALYWLGKRGGNQLGYVVDWPWLPAVITELGNVYRSLGEPNRAGSAGTPGGPIPPISWPGEK
jgi:hypothetical protein